MASHDASGTDVRALLESLMSSKPGGESGNGARGSAPAPDWRNADIDVTPLVEGLRRQNEEFLAKEMARMTEGLNALLRQMQARLNAATAELSQLKGERDQLARMKADYERKFDAIRELSRNLQG
ncbi:MAG: hypothetical protein QOE90_1595 [Thermoplasmata archaeon]|jgi:hypothetical protein|nr:hypothetical protein [Thermoplasmata archaeon]